MGANKDIKAALDSVGAKAWPFPGRLPGLIVLFGGSYFVLGLKDCKGMPWRVVRTAEDVWDVIGVRTRVYAPGSTPWVQ